MDDDGSELALSSSETATLLEHRLGYDEVLEGEEADEYEEKGGQELDRRVERAVEGGHRVERVQSAARAEFGRRRTLLLLAFITVVTALATAAAARFQASRSHWWETDDASFEGLAQRLKGRKVVMIGDSIMRYKYITLTHYLATGVKLSTLPNANSTLAGIRNPVVETTWNSWNDFYDATLEDETCDCWRSSEHGDSLLMKENRRFVKDGFDVSFYQHFRNHGSCTFHGHSGEGSLRASPVEEPYHWCYTIEGMLENMINRVHPDILLLNTGLWQAATTEYIKAVSSALPYLKQVVWFPTTNTRDSLIPQGFDTPVTSQFANHSHATVADSWTISTMLLARLGSEAVYWDRMHFFAFGYELMLQDALLKADL